MRRLQRLARRWYRCRCSGGIVGGSIGRTRDEIALVPGDGTCLDELGAVVEVDRCGNWPHRAQPFMKEGSMRSTFMATSAAMTALAVTLAVFTPHVAAAARLLSSSHRQRRART